MLDRSQATIITPLFDWEGALPDESNEAYHKRDEYLSSTTIKMMAKSPAHFYAYGRGQTLESEDLDFGTKAHDIILLNNDKNYITLPEFEPVYEVYIGRDKSVKVRIEDGLSVKDQETAFKEDHPGKTIVSTQEYRDLMGMKSVFYSNKELAPLLEGCEAEKGFLYWDELHQRRCKFRTDLINIKKRIILDYKTCFDASPYGFRKAMARYGYPLSGAHYVTGAKRLFGEDFRFIFVAQEKKEPYAIGLYEMRKISMDKAMKQRSKYLMRINECRSLDAWPDYSEHGITKVDVPDYAFGEDD